MLTKLMYMLEDDFELGEGYGISVLYPEKKSWLESLRYNLDVAVEYDDFSRKESNKRYQKAVKEAIGNPITTNGFWYSAAEIKMFFTNNDVIIRWNDYSNEALIYLLEEDYYRGLEDIVINTNRSVSEIKKILKKYIKDEFIDINKIAKEIYKTLNNKKIIENNIGKE